MEPIIKFVAIQRLEPCSKPRVGIDSDQLAFALSLLFRNSSVDVLGGLWHLLNLYAPAAGVALFASAMAKLMWRRQLAGVRPLRLWLWSGGCAALVTSIGLVTYGRDGKMATYGAMVVACALGLWWAGFGPGRR
jgi:hypothetical protein